MAVQKVNCYLCGQTIGANEDHERVERGALVLWAHPKCLAAPEQSEAQTNRK